MKLNTPSPVCVATVCSECGLAWSRHPEGASLTDCIRLLKEDLARPMIWTWHLLGATKTNNIAEFVTINSPGIVYGGHVSNNREKDTGRYGRAPRSAGAPGEVKPQVESLDLGRTSGRAVTANFHRGALGEEQGRARVHPTGPPVVRSGASVESR